MPLSETRDVFVAGAGMVPFTKPGVGESYDKMAARAVAMALEDASVGYETIGQAYVGYVYGDSTCGQKALYDVGMTGIPVINVNNNCSTGSTALYLARQAIAHGAAECALALGFEQMKPGALGNVYEDRPSPLDKFDARCDILVGHSEVPLALRYFGGAGRSHMEKYGTTLEDFAHVRAKASRHAANNPLALFRKTISAEEVMASPVMWPGGDASPYGLPTNLWRGGGNFDVSRLCPPQRHFLKVKITAQVMNTDSPSTFQSDDMMRLVGYDMTASAAHDVYEAAGIGPQDVDVVELHDCFAQNELITYEALGLCPQGGAQKFIADGDNTYGGKYVTNPSGGVIVQGASLGATGLAQCFELTRQLQGRAGERQVENARVALQHNLGLGGACVVTLYEAAA